MNLNDVLESERPGQFLYYYALDNGRLDPKWEKLFLEFKDMWYILLYARFVIQDRWSEAEPILLKEYAYALVWYAEYVIKERWEEAEHIILKSKDAYALVWYAEYVIKDRWPEAEPIIKQDPHEWVKYCSHFNIKEENGPK